MNQNFTGINEQQYWNNQMRGDHGGIPTTNMDFQMKERKRRTVSDQIEFNMERIGMLHKELSELKQMLKPYTVDHAEREEVLKTDGTGEVNSEMMYTLLRETAMINELIQYVNELKRDLQV